MNSDENIESEAAQNFSKKDELSRTLSAGSSGAPEFKANEKSNYIGEFRERVLVALTKDKIGKKEYYPKIEEALKDKRAKELLMNGNIILATGHDYRMLASKYDIPSKEIYDKQLTGDIALIVVSDDAVDVEEIYITL